jgi:hypothetical protein
MFPKGWIAAGLAGCLLAACGPTHVQPPVATAPATPAGPHVTYVVDESGGTSTSWDAALQASAANAVLLGQISQSLALARAIPIVGQAPAAGLDVVAAPTTWVIGVAGQSTPVTIAPGVERCLPGATLSKGCTLVTDDALVDGKPELVPNLLKGLQKLPFVRVDPLAVKTIGSGVRPHLTVTGQGWVGPVTLSAAWGPAGTPQRLAVVQVNAKGDFTWSGTAPTTPSRGKGALQIVARDAFTHVSAPA